MKRRAFLLGSMSLSALALPISSKLLQNEYTVKGVTMIIHPAETRGVANHGWLNSHHTFSFADYYNPERMGFGALRVINDDVIDAGAGFGRHPHKDMEIITIPLEGSLSHQDSEGNSSIIKKGEVQIMSAGTGIFHSEMNASTTDPVKLLQIWVLPKKLGVKPRYEQKVFSLIERQNKIATIVSPDGKDGSVSINQDAYFSLTDLSAGKTVKYERNQEGNGLYIFVVSGEVEIAGKKLKARDALGMAQFDQISLAALVDSEVLLMEVPA